MSSDEWEAERHAILAVLDWAAQRMADEPEWGFAPEAVSTTLQQLAPRMRNLAQHAWPNSFLLDMKPYVKQNGFSQPGGVWETL